MSGGYANWASGSWSNVSGGRNSCATGNNAAVGGGCQNCAIGANSFIGGGWYNRATGNCSVVAGGCNGTASGNYSFLGSGEGNTSSGQHAALVGGVFNQATNTRTFVGGGQANCATATWASVLGGYYNVACHSYSNVMGNAITSGATNTTYVNALAKQSGTFRIHHPDPSKTACKYLQHSFVEAPTRGTNLYDFDVTTINCTGSVTLPDYYKFLNENDRVFVSPKNHFGAGYGVVDSCQTCLTVYSNCDGDFNVLLMGVRKDIDALNGWTGVEVWK